MRYVLYNRLFRAMCNRANVDKDRVKNNVIKINSKYILIVILLFMFCYEIYVAI